MQCASALFLVVCIQVGYPLELGEANTVPMLLSSWFPTSSSVCSYLAEANTLAGRAN